MQFDEMGNKAGKTPDAVLTKLPWIYKMAFQSERQHPKEYAAGIEGLMQLNEVGISRRKGNEHVPVLGLF